MMNPVQHFDSKFEIKTTAQACRMAEESRGGAVSPESHEVRVATEARAVGGIRAIYLGPCSLGKKKEECLLLSP